VLGSGKSTLICDVFAKEYELFDKMVDKDNEHMETFRIFLKTVDICLN